MISSLKSFQVSDLILLGYYNLVLMFLVQYTDAFKFDQYYILRYANRYICLLLFI
jgi:hypothetical protein